MSAPVGPVASPTAAAAVYIAEFIAEHHAPAAADLIQLGCIPHADELKHLPAAVDAVAGARPVLRLPDQLRLHSEQEAQSGSGFSHVCWREVYVMVNCFLALEHLSAGRFLKAIEVADKAMIFGAPPAVLAELIEQAERNLPCSTNESSPHSIRAPMNSEDIALEQLNPIRATEGADLSVEHFQASYVKTNQPLLIRNSETASWPALTSWNNLEDLRQRFGHRTVPIELGCASDCNSFSERMVSIADFIDQYLAPQQQPVSPTPQSPDITTSKRVPAYLAQHPLFDQIRGFKDDFCTPKYIDDANVTTHAWFGNAFTETPLHFDSSDNLLVQVVGSKKVRLYDPSQTRYLYRDKRVTGNSALSQGNVSKLGVSAESPDFQRFPKARNATFQDVVIQPGDTLYIPQGYWHFVRALPEHSPHNFSFSVSFFF